MSHRITMLFCHCVLTLFLASTIARGASLNLSIDAPDTIEAGQTLLLSAKVQSDSETPITLQFKKQEQTLPANFTWLEAEVIGKSNKIIEDADASNLKAIQATRQYETAIKAPFPQDDKTYVLWFRAKGASFCLKGSDFENGKDAREIQWNWHNSTDWQWSRFKALTAGKVGKVFMLMKSPSKVGLIDAVMLTTDTQFKPNPTLVTAPGVFAWPTLPTTIGEHDLSITAMQDGQTVTATHTIKVTAPVAKVKTNDTPVITFDKQSSEPIDLSKLATPWSKINLPFVLNGQMLDQAYSRINPNLNINKASGVIALQCKQFMDLPQTVDIAVHQKAAGLVFVHTQYMQRDPFHAVAMYNIEYDDGSSVPVLLREEVNIAGSLRPPSTTQAQVLGSVGKEGVDYHIILFPWTNPHPEKTISKVVFTNQINRENKQENTTLGFNVADATSQILLSLSLIKSSDTITTLTRSASNQADKINAISHATIDFAQSQGEISRSVFSTNETGTMMGKDDRFDQYKQLIDKMGCDNIRLHSGIRLEWIFQTPNSEGDFTKLDERIAALKAGMPDRDIMFCFNYLPKYINPSEPKDRQTFARLCAKVVEHLNSKPETYVKYWEIYNEPFSKVIPEDRGHWKMYNLTVKAMKAVDSNIKVGGYAPCWPILSAMKDFYQHCHEYVDFISWHKYPTGNSETPTEYLMKNTGQFGTDVQNVRKLVENITPGKKVELALTEYHVNFNWRPHDPRQATNVGSTWMASVIYHMLINDMDIAQSWHSRSGGTFGMMSKSLEVRPTGQLLYMLNRHMNGQRVQSRSDNPWVEVLGFVTKEGKQGMFIINKSDTAQSLNMQLLHAKLPASDPFEGNATCHRIGPKGYSIAEHWLSPTPHVELLPYEVQLILAR